MSLNLFRLFSFTGCAFLTYVERASAEKAQKALHERITLPGVSASRLCITCDSTFLEIQVTLSTSDSLHLPPSLCCSFLATAIALIYILVPSPFISNVHFCCLGVGGN